MISDIIGDIIIGERDYELALKTSFHCLDLDMRGNAGDDEGSHLGPGGSHLEPAGSHLEPGGTTAVVVLIKDNCIFCVSLLGCCF